LNFEGYNDSVFDASLTTPEKKYQLVGGALCLDFCNTVGGTREGIARENLHSYAHFVAWCEQAGVLTEIQRQALNQKAELDPQGASAVLGRALELREAIYRIFFALSRQQEPALGDLGLINGELSLGLGRLRISREAGGNGFGWKWAMDDLDLQLPLGPLAHSAANLLVAHDCCAHVRQCRADNCGWLFVDTSKNHSRCWCDMRDCCNRAKVRRHRQKQRES